MIVTSNHKRLLGSLQLSPKLCLLLHSYTRVFGCMIVCFFFVVLVFAGNEQTQNRWMTCGFNVGMVGYDFKEIQSLADTWTRLSTVNS